MTAIALAARKRGTFPGVVIHTVDLHSPQAQRIRAARTRQRKPRPKSR